VDRVTAGIVALGLCAAPALAQERMVVADFIEQALLGCHDGVHAITDAEVEHHSISFRAGPREVRVFFGSVGINYAEQGSAGRSYRRDARLTLTCTNAQACMSNSAWDAQRAAAREQFGIVVLSVASLSNQAMSLVCADLPTAQGLQRALQLFQRAAAP